MYVRHGNKNAQNVYLIQDSGKESFLLVAINKYDAGWIVQALNDYLQKTGK